MKKMLYKDNLGYVTSEVSTIPTDLANASEENRIKFVTDLAAIARGKYGSINPPVRYKQLLKEAAPNELNIKNKNLVGSPSRPLEFCPVKLIIQFDGLGIFSLYSLNGDLVHTFENLPRANYLLKYSYLDDVPYLRDCPYSDKKYYAIYTNLRALINAGVLYENIPYNTSQDLKHFVALRAMVPMFVWAQTPNTHTAISKEAQSDRFTENVNYWLPDDFRERVFNFINSCTNDNIFLDMAKEILACAVKEEIVNILLSNYSQNTIQEFFKEIGYPAEIYSRAIYYFKYKEVVMTGWKNDPNVWEHLLIERSAEPDIWNNHTQNETKIFVYGIKEVINTIWPD